jgi:N-acetyl-1-D-myo-inositol-2-amino-2-deoxy-alpha-D-glucopyranoside deacetylase
VEPLGLLVVQPHPDDECISTGGTLARYVDEGVRVKLVHCTRGEAGSNLAGLDLGDRQVAALRLEELADALEVLGVTDHEFLGYRDSGMVDTDDNAHPDSFHQSDLDEAAGRLAGIIRAFRPQVVTSDDEQGGYGHPDHVKANRVTARAVQLAADTGVDLPGEPWRVAKRYVHTLPKGRMLEAHNLLLELVGESPWGAEPITRVSDLPFGTPDEEITTLVPVGDQLGRKMDALRQHRSQVADDSFFFSIPEEVTAGFFGTEAFALREGQAHGQPEDDLFAGLRP